VQETDDDPQLALEELAKDERNLRENPYFIAMQGLCKGRLKCRAEARAAYDEVLRIRNEFPNEDRPNILSFYLAIAAMGIEEPYLAVEWLAQSLLIEHHPISLMANVWPPFRHLSDCEEFRSLICDEMHLELGPGMIAPAFYV
jgi:hypothetical protein